MRASVVEALTHNWCARADNMPPPDHNDFANIFEGQVEEHILRPPLNLSELAEALDAVEAQVGPPPDEADEATTSGAHADDTADDADDEDNGTTGDEDINTADELLPSRPRARMRIGTSDSEDSDEE